MNSTRRLDKQVKDPASGSNLFLYSYLASKFDISFFLLDQGLDPNSVNEKRETALI